MTSRLCPLAALFQSFAVTARPDTMRTLAVPLVRVCGAAVASAALRGGGVVEAAIKTARINIPVQYEAGVNAELILHPEWLFLLDCHSME